MIQTVVAVFNAAFAARAAVQDIEVARFPDAVIRCASYAKQHPQVTVTVNEGYTDAVTGILEQYGATEIHGS
jgi:hypothetical protein